eukprot:m.139299 g.139299  ORF g.139299 m.139299 type:complete len:128 (+) comp17617_c0_seq3:1012-1395(+)
MHWNSNHELFALRTWFTGIAYMLLVTRAVIRMHFLDDGYFSRELESKVDNMQLVLVLQQQKVHRRCISLMTCTYRVPPLKHSTFLHVCWELRSAICGIGDGVSSLYGGSKRFLVDIGLILHSSLSVS